MILAINAVIAKPITASSDPELLPGFTRMSLPSGTYSSADGKVYRQIANHGTGQNIMTVTGDVTILTKYRELLSIGGYGCDLILSKTVDGSDQVDIYLPDTNQIQTYVDNGSGGNVNGGVITLDRWYGLRRVGTNIQAVSTLDGVIYTTIADFGTRVDYNYFMLWGYDGGVGGATVSNPQIKT